jgi:methylglutamate dehydrogenase subunit B
MRIFCPNCGERGVHEFSYRGDAQPIRPTAPAAAPIDAALMASFIDYVYFRDNSPGLHTELWYHSGGCRVFLKVSRNVTTHEISQVEAVR